MSEPQTTVVIVTYRAREVMGRTASAVKRSYDAGLVRCIVVDNGSADGTVEYLRENHPWLTVVPSSVNLGFGRGCNLGAAHATTPYLLFLNPDADLEPDAVVTLVGFLECHPCAGLIAPAIVHPDGNLQGTGDLPTPWSILRAAAGRPTHRDIQPGTPAFQSQWVCGAVLMVRSRVFDKLGGFDPRFFLYFEETDLCRRALDIGTEIWAVGQAVAHHLDGAIARRTGRDLFQGCIAQHYFESRFYYLVKHYGRVAAVATEIAELGILTLRAIPRWLRGRGAEPLRIRLRSPILRQPAEAPF